MNDIIRTLQFEKEQLEARIRLLEDKLDSDNRQISEYDHELRQAKRLLKAAVEDFAKLDRVNTKLRNCMIPDMDCADCPLSWNSVDDSVEPCHNWRFAAEALALIGEEGDTND